MPRNQVGGSRHKKMAKKGQPEVEVEKVKLALQKKANNMQKCLKHTAMVSLM